jgi:hypothetical protein
LPNRRAEIGSGSNDRHCWTKDQGIRDAIRETARHDMNDSGWTLTCLADHKYDFIKPFRQKWRLTPKGERAIKFHAEKDAFHAKGKGGGEPAAAGP